MRVDAISESPILTLIDRIFEQRRQGHEILGLHIGEPDFDTPAGIRAAAARALEEGFTHYAPAAGLAELREAIADRLHRLYAVSPGADDVVVLPGKLAIYATLLSTTDPGDEVLLPDPTYLFEQPVQLAGARPVYFPLRPDFSFDPDALEAAITQRSRVLVLTSPSNPTGRLLSRSELRDALRIAQDHDLTVVSDETYESLVYEGSHVPAAAVEGGAGRVVTIGSFSKMFAMTGWRAGYAVAPPAVRRRLIKVVEHTLTCVPPFVQRACLWGLQNADSDIGRFRDEFRRRRDHLYELLRQVPGLEVHRPEGAFYMFPGYSLPIPSVDFCHQLLDQEKLAVVPGISFGRRGEGHVRISFTSPIEVLDEGVRRLRHFLEQSTSVKVPSSF